MIGVQFRFQAFEAGPIDDLRLQPASQIRCAKFARFKLHMVLPNLYSAFPQINDLEAL